MWDGPALPRRTVWGVGALVYSGTWIADEEEHRVNTESAAQNLIANPLREILRIGADFDPTPFFSTVNELINGGLENKPIEEIGRDILVGVAPGPNLPGRLPHLPGRPGVVPVAPKDAVPDTIYRGGRFNDSAAKDIRVDADGVSFRDSLSNPVPKPGEVPRPVLRPGKPYIEVDTSRLPPGTVIPDNVPPGHVTVTATVEEIVEAIIGGGKFPKN